MLIGGRPWIGDRSWMEGRSGMGGRLWAASLDRLFPSAVSRSEGTKDRTPHPVKGEETQLLARHCSNRSPNACRRINVEDQYPMADNSTITPKILKHPSSFQWGRSSLLMVAFDFPQANFCSKYLLGFSSDVATESLKSRIEQELSLARLQLPRSGRTAHQVLVSGGRPLLDQDRQLSRLPAKCPTRPTILITRYWGTKYLHRLQGILVHRAAKQQSCPHIKLQVYYCTKLKVRELVPKKRRRKGRKT